jgi:hypothetical protein
MNLTEKINRDRILDKLKSLLPAVKESSAGVALAKKNYEELSAEALDDMLKVVTANGGSIRFEYDGTEMAAKVVQGQKSGVWQLAQLIEHLKETKRWNSVSARILDPKLLEAAIARGEIDGELLKKKFWVEGDMNSPYVKFVSADSDSL